MAIALQLHPIKRPWLKKASKKLKEKIFAKLGGFIMTYLSKHATEFILGRKYTKTPKEYEHDSHFVVFHHG